METNLVQLLTQNTETAGFVAELLQRLARARESAVTLNAQRDEQRRRANDLHEQLQVEKTETGRLKRQVEALNEEAGALTGENISLKEKNADLAFKVRNSERNRKIASGAYDSISRALNREYDRQEVFLASLVERPHLLWVAVSDDIRAAIMEAPDDEDNLDPAASLLGDMFGARHGTVTTAVRELFSFIHEREAEWDTIPF